MKIGISDPSTSERKLRSGSFFDAIFLTLIGGALDLWGKNRVGALPRKGADQPRIAESLGVSISTVQRVLKEEESPRSNLCV